MRKTIQSGLVALVLLALVAGSIALVAAPKRPANCQPCGGEFNNTQPSSCGIGGPEVLAYKANGDFAGLYSNRCFACTANGVFCTVDGTAQ